MNRIFREPGRKTNPKPFLAFLGLSILYFAGSGLIGAKRVMWYDELWTYYIARTPDIRGIWAALSVLPEFVPPLSFVLTRFSHAIFGTGEFGTRFPNMIGLWLGGLCLAIYCRRRFSSTSAVFAFLFLLLSGLYMYSYEARPYGLLIGFTAASFACWHAFAEGHRRMLFLMAMSIAAAVSVHYYAVFVLLPLAAGELVRVRFVVSKAILCLSSMIVSAFVPLLFFLPLITHNLGYASTFWARPRWAAIWETYVFLLGPSIWALGLVILSGIFGRKNSTIPAAGGFVTRRIPDYELAAVIVFVFIPLFGVILGKTITNAYSLRYGIQAVIGLTILSTAFFHQVFLSRSRVRVVLLAALACFFFFRQVDIYRSFSSQRFEQERTYAFLRSNPGLPLAVADPRYFLQLSHYATPDLSSRLVYLASPVMAKKYAGDSMLDDGLILLKKIAPVNVQPFKLFREQRRPFLIYWNPGPMSWLLGGLMDTNCPLELKAQSGVQFIYFCEG